MQTRVFLINFVIILILHMMIFLPSLSETRLVNEDAKLKVSTGRISFKVKQLEIIDHHIKKRSSEAHHSKNKTFKRESKNNQKDNNKSHALKPVLKTNSNPKYPYLSRIHNEQGVGIFKVKIQKGNKVSDVTIISSTGHERLDEAAMIWLKQAQYQIPDSNLSYELTQEVVFKLDR